MSVEFNWNQGFKKWRVDVRRKKQWELHEEQIRRRPAFDATKGSQEVDLENVHFGHSIPGKRVNKYMKNIKNGKQCDLKIPCFGLMI